MNRYVLKPNALGKTPEIEISEQDYLEAKKCHKKNYEAFEIELAFDFVVKNYIEIEKYIAEHLVLEMVGHEESEDRIRNQMWGFMRVLSNWLASISFWHNIAENRLIKICGRGETLQSFKDDHSQLQTDEFSYALLFHLRDYSQHGGFPITGFNKKSSWNDSFTQLGFSTNYNLNYEDIRPYFEIGTGNRNRKEFGKRIEEYSKGKPFDLKPIIRQSLGHLGKFMDNIRAAMSSQTSENENLILELIKKYTDTCPDTSIVGLSAVSVNDINNNVPIRDEFILRAKKLRKKNNESSLKNMEKRIISIA